MSHHSSKRRPTLVRAASSSYESNLMRNQASTTPKKQMRRSRSDVPVNYIDTFTVTDLHGRPLELERVFAPGGDALLSGTQIPFCGRVENEAEQYAQDKDEDGQEEVYDLPIHTTWIAPYDIGTDRLLWVLSDDRWLILLSSAHEQEALHGNFLLAHRLIQVVVNAALMDPALTFGDLPRIILCSHDWHIIPPLDTGEDSLSLAAQIIPQYLLQYLHTLDPVAKDFLMQCPLITHYVDLCEGMVAAYDGECHTPHQLLRSLRVCTPNVLQNVVKTFPEELWHRCTTYLMEGTTASPERGSQAGDYVMIEPNQSQAASLHNAGSDSQNPYARFLFGRIVNVSHDGIFCHIQWYQHSSTVPVGELGHTQELFGTLQCDDRPMNQVLGRISLIHILPGRAPPPLNHPDYFCRFMWDASQGCFFDCSPQPDQFLFKHEAIKCIACEARAHRAHLKDAYHLPSNHLFLAEELVDIIPQVISQGYKLGVLDVFSGAGGFSCGFQQTGVLSVEAAIENSEAAAETFSLNHPTARVYCQDTETLLEDFLQHEECPQGLHHANISILCAGFPCQPFSFANRDKKMLDPRSILIANALSWVEVLRPTYVVLENVLGMFHHQFPEGEKHIIVKFLICTLTDLGYQLRMGILQSAAFGVPQTRERFIVIAAQSGCTLPNLPAPTHQFNSRATSLTLGSLKLGTSREDILYAPYPAATLKSTLENLLGPAVDGDWPELAETVRTKTQYHPVEDRPWTVTEEMVIQGFPKDYKMASKSVTEKRRMIGNAVPPPLAKAIGLEIIRANLLDRRRRAEGRRSCPIFMEDLERESRLQALGNART